LGIKREDCPAAFAGQSESRFFCSSGVGIPLVPTQASILSHSRAPPTPPTGQTEKESEKAAQTKPDDFGENEREGLQFRVPADGPLKKEGRFSEIQLSKAAPAGD